MAQHLHSALARVKAQVCAKLPVDVDWLAADVGHRWRDRVLTPAVTVRLFLLQILHGNVAITALHHLGQMTATASSYCEARARLPLTLFAQLFDAVAQQVISATRISPQGEAATLLNGRRIPPRRSCVCTATAGTSRPASTSSRRTRR